MFTDLVGSTEMLSRLGEDAAERLRRDYFRLLREAIARHGGEEVKSTGDGVMAAFRSTGDAVASAIAMQQATDRYNRDAAADVLRMRVGLDAGEPTVEGGDYYGIPVVTASRLCAAARGGQIVVSDTVRALTRTRGFDFAPLGDLELKGLDEACTAYEVRWEQLPAAVPLPPGLDTGGNFVGRGEDLATLQEAWKRASAGRREVVLVAGEPGIGKTHLVSQFARAVHEGGATVLFGRCDEEALAPYQPFVEALRHYAVASEPGVFADRAGPGASDLLRILPDLASRFPDVPEPIVAEPETERYRLFEAVATLLASAAARTPLLLVIDDLHWADKPSLMMLRNLLRTAPGSRLMILGTYRDVELDRRHPLADVLAELRTENLFERVVLRGLSEPDVQDWLRRGAGHELEAEALRLAQALHAETEGNPLFIREILRHLVETGALYQRDGRWTSDLSVEQVGLPEGVKEVIGRRLARLSEECNEMLRTASVIGRQFRLDVLERVAAEPAERLLVLADEAVRARVIEEVRGVPDAFWFSHALIRETLHEEITTSRRVRLHRKVAEALEEGGSDALGEIAYHYFESAVLDGGDKAVRYCELACARADELAAYEDAARHAERALQALELADRTDDAARLRLLNHRGLALMRAGETDEGRAVFKEALGIARKTGDGESFARAALGYTHGFMWIQMGVVDEFMKATLEEALEMLGPGDSALGSLLRGRLGSELMFAGPDADERRFALLDEALEMARRAGNPEAHFYAVRTRSTNVLWEPTAGPQRIAESDEVLALAEQVGNREAQVRARVSRGMGLLMTGDRDEFDRNAEAAEAVADDLRQPTYRWMVRLWRGCRALLDGRFDDAEHDIEDVYRIGAPVQGPNAWVWMVGQESARRFFVGGLAEFIPEAEHIFPLRRHIPSFACWEMWLKAAAGRREEAAELYRAYADSGFVLWHDGTAGTGLAAAAMSCWALGAAEDAPRLYSMILPYREAYAQAGAAMLSMGSFEYCLGLLSSTAGWHDRAVEHLALAVERNRGLRSPPLVALAQHDLARSLLALGERDRARAVMAEATETFERFGMAPWLERARALDLG